MKDPRQCRGVTVGNCTRDGNPAPLGGVSFLLSVELERVEFLRASQPMPIDAIQPIYTKGHRVMGGASGRGEEAGTQNPGELAGCPFQKSQLSHDGRKRTLPVPCVQYAGRSRQWHVSIRTETFGAGLISSARNWQIGTPTYDQKTR